MRKEGLVETGPAKALRLTDRGFLLAEDMVRRHRLAERMLVDLLGVELHRAHIEAHRLEHAISAELLVNIVTPLGNPTTCPFGGPIPGSGYERSSTEVIPLSQAEVEQRYILNRIPEEDYEFLR